MPARINTAIFISLGLFYLGLGTALSLAPVSVSADVAADPIEWRCRDGYQLLRNRCVMINVPDNAVALGGDTWKCRTGYRQVEGVCEELDIPKNAVVLGAQWECMNGYLEVDGACRRMDIPDKAVALGDQWSCINGYVQNADVCDPVQMPDNAVSMGNGWKCLSGYRRMGNDCELIDVLGVPGKDSNGALWCRCALAARGQAPHLSSELFSVIETPSAGQALRFATPGRLQSP